MKAIAYNINSKEKEWLILANYKKHEITVISNSLTLDTLNFSSGKEALIIFNQDPLSADIIAGLKALGVKYIATSSFDYSHIDLFAAKAAGLKIANIPFNVSKSPTLEISNSSVISSFLTKRKFLQLLFRH
ncbi:MAG: hypothetical protein EOO07_21005 [Chitinophagaceae bacterium]|nr:MAG: hypothetical protein EOO07_21005 [Chitinophagaceae bacterium]